MDWDESKHPRDDDGKFTDGSTPAEYNRLQEMGIEPKCIDSNGLFDQNAISVDEQGEYIYSREDFDKKLNSRNEFFKDSLDKLESQYSENDLIRLHMALDNYTSSNYDVINRIMRGEKYDNAIISHFQASIERITKAIENYENPRQIKVFRGIDIGIFKAYDIDETNINKIIGKTLCDGAFSSCSLDRDTAKIFAKKNHDKHHQPQVILELDVPKGKNTGMPLWRHSNYVLEQEFLLKPNAKIKFKSVEKNGDIYFIKGDME